jgi:Ca2+/Na+ antiporter
MKKETALLGFYAALAAFIAAAGYGVVQILQVMGSVHYPLDAILIYSFSMAIALPFLLTILALHYIVPEDRKFWSHAALLFALMYAIYVVLMYTVQLATVIPLSMLDPKENILTVTPHSFFWTLDALGYICMGLSTLFAAFLFKKDGAQRWLRRFLIANAMMIPFIGFAYFYPHFSTWVLVLGAPWLITAPGSILLLANFFRKTWIAKFYNGDLKP